MSMTGYVYLARKKNLCLSWTRCRNTCSFFHACASGGWRCPSRAVDTSGATVDLLFTARRHCNAALRFQRKAAGRHGVPRKVIIDKSGANTAASNGHTAEQDADIEIRQIKCPDDVLEQSHRALDDRRRPDWRASS